MTLPDQFFTVESMVTLTGASGATFIICNGLQRALNFNPKWLALVVAVAISCIGVYLTGKSALLDYFVGIINGFLIYATAAGATEAVGDSDNRTRGDNGDEAFGVNNDSINSPKRKFTSSWFR